MAVEPYADVDSGTTRSGVRWRVGAEGGELLVFVDGTLARLAGAQRDRFAEAVARAVTPGRVPVKHGPGCRCTPCLAEPGYRARGQVSDRG